MVRYSPLLVWGPTGSRACAKLGLLSFRVWRPGVLAHLHGERLQDGLVVHYLLLRLERVVVHGGVALHDYG